ncbi:IPExxxVDY family protein [Pedobacter puniceum]|uniref:IPExxxVDY family protein n=1 Tax=Pedobacter puniceum TaxID=2666136 RepID=A0A7K0FN56_9SPHI|nr:IPExxxVDY family protein [Pedobacter puniceum]MRX47353.1 IPExxxVDY family protein [Pedobacter puniceum]
MNKKFLKLELDFDFILISITSPLKDYRLCYHINKNLQFDFIKIDDLEITYAGADTKYYSRYLYYIEEVTPEYYLIANKGLGGYLVPELKETDYFVLIKEFIDDEDLDFFLEGLKKIEDIQAAVEVNPKKLKSKENLIF